MIHQFRSKKRRFFSKNFNRLLNLSIVVAAIYLFLAYFKKRQYINFSRQSLNKTFHFPGETNPNIDSNRQSIEYTQEELLTAISELNLPTWSRSYNSCTDSKSEISCTEIIKAWRLIKSWIYSMNSTPLNKRRFILVQHYFDGIGNRISIDTTGFLLALMSNRSLVLKGFYMKNGKENYDSSNAYLFHPLVLTYNSTIEHVFNNNNSEFTSNGQLKMYDLQVYRLFWSETFDSLFNSNIIYNIDHLIYTPILYAHYITSGFCIENFGMHAVYFLSNFLVRIPQIHIQKVQKLLKPIPAVVTVFGVHLRFQFPGQFYSYSVESTMNKVIPFLQSIQREKIVIFAFSSDNKKMEIEFLRVFGPKNVVMTKAIRLPDFDHESALLDLTLLMSCDECLLSYRSTFSYAVASRTAKRCWFVEKESPSVFQAGNSQAGAVSMLMHYHDANDWQTSRRFALESFNEDAFRYYFRYFMF